MGSRQAAGVLHHAPEGCCHCRVPVAGCGLRVQEQVGGQGEQGLCEVMHGGTEDECAAFVAHMFRDSARASRRGRLDQ